MFEVHFSYQLRIVDFFDRKLKPITIVDVNAAVNFETTTKMENRIIDAAKQKLASHKSLGAKSKMSIHEVARLMDMITFGVNNDTDANLPIFFSYSKN